MQIPSQYWHADAVGLTVFSADAEGDGPAHGSKQLDADPGMPARSDDDNAPIHCDSQARRQVSESRRAKNRLTDSVLARCFLGQVSSFPDSGLITPKSRLKRSNAPSQSSGVWPDLWICERPNSTINAISVLSVIVRLAPSKACSSAPSTSIFIR